MSRSFPIVGIGASAGGLEAFRQLLAHLPEQTGMAFVLVQHLDPVHQSLMAELLSKATRLPVTEAADGMAVGPDHVYVIPPNVNMAVASGGLQLTPRGEPNRPHLPVDFFLRSLAKAQQGQAIGVVLSGTGSDGAMGLAEIKSAGGITFAQDEDSAEYASMPLSAVGSGCVDFVLPPDQIARELARIGQHPYLRPPPATEGEVEAEGDFSKILGRLRAATGVDFTAYRDTTIKRRIARRMAVHKQESLPDYVRFLEANPAEVEALYRDVLINVTSFFRDPEVFEALKTTVFPEIVKNKSPDTPIRIWVPGCSTGQEAYSLAMALLEFMDQQAGRPPIQIFGTDINDAAAVEKARPGVYPPSIESDVSPGRLQRFFTKEDGGYRISKSIRDLCLFARHDLAADPPFSRLDLVSCRNLLIYLSVSLQQQIIPTFHYALNPGGFLVLGASESVGRFSDLFASVDKKHNIYSRAANLTHPYPHLLTRSYPPVPAGRAASPVERAPALVDVQREADRMILGRFAPAAVLIDENLEILQFRGETAPYLSPPSGQPTHNILKMARDKLFLELRSVIDEARKQNTTARREKVRVQDGQEVRLVSLEVSPVRLHGVAQRCFLVLFLQAAPPGTPVAATGGSAAPPPAEAAPPDERENAELRQELASVKEYLQAIIEQQNAANEELQSANEEARSANEELQSTNEELQTAKEELQSANEELRTVNDELQGRNQEMSQLSDDLTNTLASIRLPIVMLGSDLRIRRFTPAAATLLNLIPTDLGRPFGDVGSVFDISNLQAMLQDVIATVAVKEQEVQDRTGHWYLLTLHPYRTADNRIDGVVLLLRDIDEDKRTKEQLKQANEAKDQFLAVLSHELRTPLTPVLAAVTLLQEDRGASGEPIGEVLEMIRRNIELEARLIDDLLDATRIARGKVELDRRPVELGMIIDRTVEVCKPDIEARKLEFGVDAQAGACVVLGDAARLQQVFWNLLKNAVKFTPHGGCVGVRCRRMDGRAVVEVSDSGEGIPPEVLPRLFKPFEQGGMRTTRQFGGLGLGLTISKALVELHGGTITAQSPGKGQGSTFRVTLPIHVLPADAREAARSTEHPGARPALRPLSILLVEDHGDTARVMSRMLTRQGHEVQTAGDVATALGLIAERRFDLLISDLGLPDGSGHDLLRKLRASGQSLPAIALSGYGQQEDVEQSRAAGFAAHLIKPVKAQQLYAAIDAAAGDSR